LFLCEQMVGGVLSDELIDGMHLHLYIPHIASIVGTVMSGVYYHSVEMWNSPRFLFILLPYWFSSMIIEMMKTYNLKKRDVELYFLRPHLTRASIVLYLLLLLIELDILRQLVRCFLYIFKLIRVWQSTVYSWHAMKYKKTKLHQCVG
jgi:hypothetical protein